MLTTLKDSHPIARKEHICEFCGGKINKGQKYYRQTNIYDGCIYEWIEHEECHQIASALDMYGKCDFDEGLSPERFRDILDEYIYQEHYDDITDDIAEDWKNLTKYEEVCKILEELKEKGGEWHEGYTQAELFNLKKI